MSNAIERWFEGKRMTPLREPSHVQDSFDRMLNEFMNIKRANGVQDYTFSPSCDISEEAGNYVLKFDLPGVPKQMVAVEVDRDQLTIRAERKEEKKSESKRKYLSELYYGSYARSFTLPGPVDEKKIDASFQDGVLTVTLPKTDSAKMKQIPVH